MMRSLILFSLFTCNVSFGHVLARLSIHSADTLELIQTVMLLQYERGARMEFKKNGILCDGVYTVDLEQSLSVMFNESVECATQSFSLSITLDELLKAEYDSPFLSKFFDMANDMKVQNVLVRKIL